MTRPTTLITSRRSFLGQAGSVGLAALSLPGLSFAAQGELSQGSSLLFTAYRNGSRLGFHRIDFSRSGERLVVDIEIAFDVKLAFIPLYRYRHKNREVWEKSKLISLDTETDDNGTDLEVKAIRKADRIFVDGAEGRLDLPGDTLTTSYWNEAAIERGEWIDTQSGRLVRSTVQKKPVEPILAEGQTVQATRYDLDGDITCSLWYANSRWVRLHFLGEDGSEIEYSSEARQENG